MERINVDVLAKLAELEDLIENSSYAVFSANIVKVNKEDMLRLIKEIRIGLPNNVKQADWVQEKKDKIIKQAEEIADAKVKEAQEFCIKSASESEITKLAQRNAEEILDNAEQHAEAITEGARKYAVEMIGDVEVKIKNIQKQLEKNKKELENFDFKGKNN